MKNLFDKTEIKNIAIASIVLGFVFSFRKWGYGETFIPSVGTYNLIFATISSAIVLLIYQIAHKTIAKRYGCKSTFRIWGIKRFWFTKKSKISNLRIFGKKFKTIRFGIVLPLFFSFISNGIIKFCAIGSSEVSEIKMQRTGKKYKYLSDFDTAVIHLTGPISLLFLALLLSNIGKFEEISKIAYFVAIFSMIPLSQLDGSKIFFGSPFLYIFSLAFMILAIAVIQLTGLLTTLVFAGIAAIIILILFMIKYSHLS
tara:strand:+ start:3762 stop:4529 length:768 start_codon:yes stop_codon:yes gene_type:complete